MTLGSAPLSLHLQPPLAGFRRVDRDGASSRFLLAVRRVVPLLRSTLSRSEKNKRINL